MGRVGERWGELRRVGESCGLWKRRTVQCCTVRSRAVLYGPVRPRPRPQSRSRRLDVASRRRSRAMVECGRREGTALATNAVRRARRFTSGAAGQDPASRCSSAPRCPRHGVGGGVGRCRVFLVFLDADGPETRLHTQRLVCCKERSPTIQQRSHQKLARVDVLGGTTSSGLTRDAEDVWHEVCMAPGQGQRPSHMPTVVVPDRPGRDVHVLYHRHIPDIPAWTPSPLTILDLTRHRDGEGRSTSSVPCGATGACPALDARGRRSLFSFPRSDPYRTRLSPCRRYIEMTHWVWTPSRRFLDA